MDLDKWRTAALNILELVYVPRCDNRSSQGRIDKQKDHI